MAIQPVASKFLLQRYYIPSTLTTLFNERPVSFNEIENKIVFASIFRLKSLSLHLSVALHDDSDYKDWLVELKERFYRHRLKASCATNGYLLDFYWKLGRDIEAKQYTNTYGSGFYKNLSQDLKNEMPGVKGFSPTNLKYMSYFYKLYAPLSANRQQVADDFKLLFMIPWDHHCRIISRCKGDMDKALFFVRKTWENNWGRDALLNWLDTDLYERDGKAITNFQSTLPAVQSDLAQQPRKSSFSIFAFYLKNSVFH